MILCGVISGAFSQRYCARKVGLSVAGLGTQNYENWLFNATGEQFHPDSITRYLNRMKLTVKCISYEKRAKFSAENIAYYHEWIDIYKNTDQKRLIFCDASGFNRFNFHAKKGRGRRGERLFIASH